MYSSDRGSGTRVLGCVRNYALLRRVERDVQDGSNVEAVDEVEVLAGWVTTSVDGIRLDGAKVDGRDIHAQASWERSNAGSWVHVFLSDLSGLRGVLLGHCNSESALLQDDFGGAVDAPLTSLSRPTTGVRREDSLSDPQTSLFVSWAIESARGIEVTVDMADLVERICRVTGVSLGGSGGIVVDSG